MRYPGVSLFLCLGVCLPAATAAAVVIETVPVGDPGNVGELSGGSDPCFGDVPRICGAVGYRYNIGKYEVTAGQYCEFLNKVAATDTYGLYYLPFMWSAPSGCKIQQSGSPGSYTYSVASDYANRPVSSVNYWNACRFVNWLHNGQPSGLQGAGTTETGAYTLDGYNGDDGRTIQRNAGATWALPSEDEWYKAAYYKGGSTNAGYWDYPTRSDVLPGRKMDDVSGNNANYVAPRTVPPIQYPYYTTVAGQFRNSVGPYGTFDQMGNVKEWNETVVYIDPFDGDAYRGTRGGSYSDSGGHAIGGYGARPGGLAVSSLTNVGFRVVQIPEPASLSILAFGGACVLVRRRGSAR